MGIRFYCPNGHKLNVKDFQAGLRGVCPECGAKMQIPLESTRPSSRQEASSSPPAAPASEPPLPTPAADPAAAASDSFNSAPLTFAQSPGELVPVSTVGNPLDTAANVVWYVRPPSGGQFGPAATPIMQTWLAEGRVSRDSLVWREGWRDWQEAGLVFPQLAANPTFPGLESIAPEPIATPAHAHHAQQRVPPRRMQLIALGILGGIVLVLAVLYVLVSIFTAHS